MLILALLGAIVFYAVVYLCWESTQVPLNSLAAVLSALERMVVLPELSIFMILRGLILITVFYVVADFFIASARRAGRRRATREKPAIGLKKPPLQP